MLDSIITPVLSHDVQTHIDRQLLATINAKADNPVYTEILKQTESKGVAYVKSLQDKDWY